MAESRNYQKYTNGQTLAKVNGENRKNDVTRDYEIDNVFGSLLEPKSDCKKHENGNNLTENNISPYEEGKKGDQNGATCLDDSLEDISIKLEEKVVIKEDETFYNMCHKNRGVAVIFNHENFMEHLESDPRYGSEKDVKSLEKSFKKLGFDVQVHLDLSVADIDSVLEDLSKLDHSDSDCFVLVCLSHGKEVDVGLLYAHDAVYKPDLLWSKFTADKCPSLKGKPKLFFIQACRGKNLDAGVLMCSDGNSSRYKIPSDIDFDFLIAYSQVPGYTSFRSSENGTWFIQELCRELDKNSSTLNILVLLTLVNRRVAVAYESYIPKIHSKHKRKQNPCISYMLTRLLIFPPKD